ncbi:MAG: prolyl oligopeptidase family serine peptidase, partial [Acidobacteriota bacterium]|nr:prolyl oligopeptidase family serine peptidase [Acidobacteriota bacterium]
NQFLAIIDQEKLYSLRKFVLAGYVVVASQYRGGGGSEGQDEFGGADIDDVLSLIPLVDSLAYADGSRIGMFGWSRGGMMTYLALARTSRIAAAVIAAAPTDLALAFKMRPEMEGLAFRLIPNYAQKKTGAIEARSAVFWPEKLPKNTPFLLLQGSADRNCDPSDVLKMALRLYEAKQPFRLVFFEGGSHGLNEHTAEVDRLIMSWFDGHLRGSK